MRSSSNQRRTLVLLISSFTFPLVALLSLWAFEGTEVFLRWVIVGIAVLSITAAWETSGIPVDADADADAEADAEDADPADGHAEGRR